MSRHASLVVNGVQAAVCAAIAVPLIFGSAATADEKEAVLKFTAVELTSKFRDDKTDKLFLQYHGKIVEVEGEVRYSQKFATGKGWLLQLKGCKESDARVLYWAPSDIHKTRTRLRLLGYAVSEIEHRDYGQTEFFLTDDDGYSHCFGVATKGVANGSDSPKHAKQL
jgi:hypothetical protein